MPDTTDGLIRPFKDNVEALLRAGNGRVYLASGHRTYAEQYALRVGRVPKGQEMNPRYPGKPLTAVPGTSRHESGLAADLHPTNPANGYGFIHELGRRFNISFPLWARSRVEPWHGEPLVMAPAPDVGPVPTLPPLPVPAPVHQEDDNDMTLFRVIVRPDGKRLLILIGTDNLVHYRFVGVDDKWVEVAGLADPRYGLQAAALPDNSVSVGVIGKGDSPYAGLINPAGKWLGYTPQGGTVAPIPV